jgi:predicted PurR-regulated permease PerM
MPIQFPSYAKTLFILLTLSIILVFIYLGQHILIPIMLSVLLAILLKPVVDFFNRRLKLPHVIAILLSVILFILFIACIIFFMSWQISDITSDWNQIKENLAYHYKHLQQWMKQHLQISYDNQEKYIQQATRDSLNNSDEIVANTLNSFRGFLLNTILIPVYTFLLLLYRGLLVTFLSKFVKADRQNELRDILKQVQSAIQSFLVGLLLEMFIVATLTTIGLMIIGLQYALLFGVITGILNLIPYIGILFAAFLTILATLTNSTDLSLIIGVVIVNICVQFTDNNFLVPFIVSSKVRINALVSLVGIITGGAIAGIAGMFLAIPTIAILKVIFDHVEGLRPWGLLLGDDYKSRKRYKWRKIKWRFFSGDKSNNKENFKDTSMIKK